MYPEIDFLLDDEEETALGNAKNRIISVWDDIYQIIHDLHRGVTNCIKYFKTIWVDRDWDGAYIYYLLRIKLKSIEKSFSDPDQYVQIPESAAQIVKYARIARILLDRLIEDDFMDPEYFKNIKYEFIPCEDNKKLVELKCITQYTEEERAAKHLECHLKKQKTKRLFFLILEKRIEHWWD